MDPAILYSYQRKQTMARLNTQTRYTSQVAQDRRAAAAQRAEERRLTGSADVDQVNRLYTQTLW